MVLTIFAYILHCLIAFAYIYSCDVFKIWGKNVICSPTIPNELNINDDEAKQLNEISYYSDLREYIKKKILLRHRHLILLKDIIRYSEATDNVFPSIISTKFLTVLLGAIGLKISYFIDSFVLAVIVTLLVFAISDFIIYFIYKKSGKCNKIRAKHFDGTFKSSDFSDCESIEEHCEYLESIQYTVFYRFGLRKMLNNFAFVSFFIIPIILSFASEYIGIYTY